MPYQLASPALLRMLTACLLLCACLPVAQAQKVNKWVAKGEAALAEQSYLQAIDYFQWSLRTDTSVAAASGLARSYQALSDSRKAADWWLLASKRSDATPLTYYQLGRAQMSLGKTDAAIASFRRYYEAAPTDPQAERYLDVEAWLPAMFKDTALYVVERLRINSKYADYGAAWYEDGILFSSNRPREVGVIHSSASDGLPLSDLYFSRWDSTKGWGKPAPFAAANSRFHDGPACVDKPRGLVYLTRSSAEPTKRKAVAPLSILSFSDEGGKWTPSTPLPLPTTAGAGHPAISPDGRRLYFSSDMPGGQGGTDIWYLDALGSGWSDPINAGPVINTPGQESYPAVQSDGSLYFCSDGHPGIGGLDIFFSRPDGNGWRPPLNPGAPLNSPRDDFAFQPKGEGAEGLFSSNRNGNHDDIWSYNRSAPAFDCQMQKENVYCFRFSENGSMETDTMPFYYAWNMGDGTILRGLDVTHCFAGPGDYLVELQLIDSISGYVFLAEATEIVNVRDSIQPFIEAPTTVLAGEPVSLDAVKSILPDCNPQKYFWEFGDGERGIGLSVSHTYDQAGTYQIRLGITGDQPGSSAPCRSCVSRSIRVLPAGSRLPDPPAKGLPRQTPKEEIKQRDSISTPLMDLRDSTDLSFRVKVASETQPLNPKLPPLSQLDDQASIKMTKVGNTYQYTYGDEKTRSDIYPKYTEALEKGMEDAVVVAFKDDIEIVPEKENLRVPGIRNGNTFTIFSGDVRDANGSPLSVELTIEDLIHNVQVVKLKTDSSGVFRLRLPNGQLYGYYMEIPGFFPYSDQIDLQDLKKVGAPGFKVEQHITMFSLKEIIDKGKAVRINNIFFDYDKSELRTASFTELDALLTMLRANPQIKVEIHGHTDQDGDALYNLELSKRRAEAVAAYLRARLPQVQILQTIGYGESTPLLEETSPEAKQRNRRVEFRLFTD
jgi:outer membrane protein OmpA-like peptidoglycan-associated protein